MISTYGSANPETALAFASEYGGPRKSFYRNFLQQNTKANLFYNPWINSFYFTSSKPAVCGQEKIILQIDSYGDVATFISKFQKAFGCSIVSYKKKFSNALTESVYELAISN